MTPEKYFCGSPDAAKIISIRFMKSLYTLDNFVEIFFRPDIIKGRLERLAPSKTKLMDLSKGFKTPPIMTLLAKRSDGTFGVIATDSTEIIQGVIRVKAIAKNNGGGIYSVRLANNGKTIGESFKGAKATKPNEIFEQEFSVSLNEGANRLGAVGISDDRSESNASVGMITYVLPKHIKPDLYILSMGINTYQNETYNLRYCESDAVEFADVLRSKTKKFFGNVYPKNLINQEATRANVLKVFEEVKSKCKPDDVFVFFYAGQGIVLDIPEDKTTKSEYFYVLSDVAQMSDPIKVSQEGLSGTEIKKILTDIKATKQLLFIDAYNADGTSNESALAKLSRASGAAILASTANDQLALEFKDLEYDPFAWALMDALKDGQITPTGIKNHMDEKIPDLIKKYKAEERPRSPFIWGPDFPIGVKP